MHCMAKTDIKKHGTLQFISSLEYRKKNDNFSLQYETIDWVRISLQSMFNVTLHVCHYLHANIDGLKVSDIIRGMNYITPKDK